MKHKYFDFRTAYIDLLLNFMVGLVFISILSTPIQNKSKSEGIKKNAEMIIQVDWNPSQDCDVDIWVRDPMGNIVFFTVKDKGLMHIERDDLGFRNDILTTAKELVTGNKVTSDTNQEIWVLRGKVQGEFTVNLHLYSCRNEGNQLKVGDPVNVPVTVSVIKVNPDYEVLRKETVTLTRVWQEITVMNMTLDKDGYISRSDKTFRNLVKTREGQ